MNVDHADVRIERPPDAAWPRDSKHELAADSLSMSGHAAVIALTTSSSSS